MKFYPYKRGAGTRCFSYAEWRRTKSFVIVLTWELDVLAILMGGGGVTTL